MGVAVTSANYQNIPEALQLLLQMAKKEGLEKHGDGSAVLPGIRPRVVEGIEKRAALKRGVRLRFAQFQKEE